MTQQVGLSPPIEGILGMSLNNTFLMSEQTYAVGPLLIDALTKANQIPANEFNFYMQPAISGTSNIDIGPP